MFAASSGGRDTLVGSGRDATLYVGSIGAVPLAAVAVGALFCAYYVALVTVWRRDDDRRDD
eukprot:gene16504-5076_t